ncbi:hypothetical protein D3C86_1638090 [compost metagenome]
MVKSRLLEMTGIGFRQFQKSLVDIGKGFEYLTQLFDLFLRAGIVCCFFQELCNPVGGGGPSDDQFCDVTASLRYCHAGLIFHTQFLSDTDFIGLEFPFSE